VVLNNGGMENIEAISRELGISQGQALRAALQAVTAEDVQGQLEKNAQSSAAWTSGRGPA
jgi:hypothetical protein